MFCVSLDSFCIFSASLSEHKRSWYGTFVWTMCRSIGRLVGQLVCKVYCGKMACCIQMPFGVVSGVGRGMGVLDGGGYRRRGQGNFGVKLGIPL